MGELLRWNNKREALHHLMEVCRILQAHDFDVDDALYRPLLDEQPHQVFNTLMDKWERIIRAKEYIIDNYGLLAPEAVWAMWTPYIRKPWDTAEIYGGLVPYPLEHRHLYARWRGIFADRDKRRELSEMGWHEPGALGACEWVFYPREFSIDYFGPQDYKLMRLILDAEEIVRARFPNGVVLVIESFLSDDEWYLTVFVNEVWQITKRAGSRRALWDWLSVNGSCRI